MKKNVLTKVLAVVLTLITVVSAFGGAAFAALTPHEHLWDAGKVITETSCAAPGTRIYTCTECGKTKEESIPALAHIRNPQVEGKPVDATCTEEGCILYRCAVCGHNYRDALTPALGHDFSGEDQICTRCGIQKDTGKEACKRCGKIHDKNLIDRLEGGWHLIVYTFTRLFNQFAELINSLKK